MIAWRAALRGALLLTGVFLLVVGCGGRAGSETKRVTVEAALRARLDQQHLSYQWVVCTRMSGRFKGSQISRCNVNFGDPHVVPYCAALVNGTLVTDHENHTLDCGPRLRADEQGAIATAGR